MEKWYIKNIKGDVDKVSKNFKISKLTSKILINRGFKNIEEISMFLDPSLTKLHDPYLMKDILKAANILKDTIIDQDSIRIIGDYDQDGNSSIVTLFKGITRVGGKVDYDIPDRVIDGYGINERLVEKAYKDGIKTIITCDNGISAFKAVDRAIDLGMKIIVTDHHDIPYRLDKEKKIEKIPQAHAVVNPKQEKCTYPFKELCGAGVAFKVIQVLYDIMEVGIEESYDLLEFVAMGTVCDVVDLLDENRIIVSQGLKLINNTSNLGLNALIKENKLVKGTINTYTLGFVIGPCINASGRLDDAKIAAELFLTNDEIKAQNYANKLYNLNEKRKDITEEGFVKVLDKIERQELDKNSILLAYEPSIHESVAGIIAGRVKDSYYRPTIILSNSKKTGIIKGSARSIKEYDMYDKLNQSEEYLVSYGGHPMAAGLSLKKEDLDEFYENLLKNSDLTKEDLTPKLYMDMYLPVDYLNFDFVQELNMLEPFGKANPRPIFADKGLKVGNIWILGKNQNTIKLKLLTGKGNYIEALYFVDAQEFTGYLEEEFGQSELNKAMNGFENNIQLDIVYYPDINTYMNNTSLQLVIKSYRKSL